MKFLLVIILLTPMLALGKSLTFTPIGVNLTEVYSGNSEDVTLDIIEVSQDGTELLVLLSDITDENEIVKKYFKWNPNDNFTSERNYTLSSIRMGEGFFPDNTINIIKDTNNTQFTYQTENETLVVSTEDVQTDFFGLNKNTFIQEILVASRFGKGSITGTIIGPKGPDGRGAFIWNKESGFVNVNDNDKTNIPICNWDNCFLNIVTGDDVGRGIAGSIQGSPLYMDIKNQTKVILEKYGFERGGISKLSSNGDYALVYYSDNNLVNTSAVYDINNDSYSLLPPFIQYHWYFGTTELSVRLSDVSDDGNLAIGYVTDNSTAISVIWAPSIGTRELTDYITSEYGVDLQGWNHLRATHLSSNGQYIYGTGTTSDGHKRIWRLELTRICESPSW